MGFLAEAVAKLASTPRQVEDLVRTFTDEQLSWKPAPEIFSVRENVMHLRDIDVEGYSKRICLILNEEHPLLPDLDGGRLARERNYNAQPIRLALADLQHARAKSVALLRSRAEHDLDHKAEMEGMGTIDLRRLLEIWIEHDAGHLHDIIELRRSIDEGTGPAFVQHSAA